jgi:hypothetical protein
MRCPWYCGQRRLRCWRRPAMASLHSPGVWFGRELRLKLSYREDGSIDGRELVGQILMPLAHNQAQAKCMVGARFLSGGGAPREALVRRAGWFRRRCRPPTARLGCRSSAGVGPWSGRPGSDGSGGPRWARAGWARRRPSILVVEAMTGRGSWTAARRPAYCSRVAGALRAHLGSAGPDGAWCALAAVSGR